MWVSCGGMDPADENLLDRSPGLVADGSSLVASHRCLLFFSRAQTVSGSVRPEGVGAGSVCGNKGRVGAAVVWARAWVYILKGQRHRKCGADWRPGKKVEINRTSGTERRNREGKR